MKQNSIYMLCGATQYEIGLQMMIQILVPILIGLVFSAIIFKTAFAVIVSKKMHEFDKNYGIMISHIRVKGMKFSFRCMFFY
mgnify:CR=1 FL=1